MNARNRERGNSLPEFAIVLVVLLSFLFGIVDFSRATYTYAFVAQLARQGARWGIVRGSKCTALDHCDAGPTDIQTYVQSLSQGLTNASSIAVTPSWTNCPAGSSGHAPGCTLSVTVTYPFSFVVLSMPVNVNGFMMASTSQMVVSQ
jgi:Flp pilus assembly protein TadG